MAALRTSIARVVRDGRLAIGWSKQTLAERAGVSRSMIGSVERGSANVTVDLADRILEALGQDVNLAVRQPFVTRSRQSDAGHATFVAHVSRRLTADDWRTRREVEIVHGRSHGWIDVLAFQPSTGTLLIIEVKTELRDLGRIERTLAWYAREAPAAARAIGWQSTRVKAWLLLLATAETDERLRRNQAAIDQTLRGRAMEMLDVHGPPAGLALIDPRSRQRNWLMRTRSDGRRTPAPYRDYADFMARTDGRARTDGARGREIPATPR